MPQMASMNDLLDSLADCEMSKFGADQDAARRMREAELKVTQATEHLAETRRAHDHELRRLKAQCEKRLRDSAYETRRQTRVMETEKAAMEGCVQQAEETQRRAEDYVHALEAKVAYLQASLHARVEEAEDKCNQTKREMEDRVGRVTTQCNQRIQSMQKHTRNVEEITLASAADVQQEHGEQLARAHIRAEGRLRFKELCGLSKQRGEQQITKEVYENSKSDLIRLWHTQAMHQRGRMKKPMSLQRDVVDKSASCPTSPKFPRPIKAASSWSDAPWSGPLNSRFLNAPNI